MACDEMSNNAKIEEALVDTKWTSSDTLAEWRENLVSALSQRGLAIVSSLSTSASGLVDHLWACAHEHATEALEDRNIKITPEETEYGLAAARITRLEQRERELVEGLRVLESWGRCFVENSPITAETLWKEFPKALDRARALLKEP